ncbi:MAG TPA: hypothetical protein VLE99_04920 [Candidatus Saccharimonadales bacterium]|nr:hypothetical protein [Candidatus Saccharimonadales bacterium]
MDKHKLVYFRLVGGLFLLAGLICFLATLPFMSTAPALFNGRELTTSAGFWLSLVGYYGTYTVFHFQNKPYNQYHGNKSLLGLALLLLGLGGWVCYYFFRVQDHMGWYEIVTILAGAITFGMFGLFTLIMTLVQLRMRRTVR